MLDEFYTQLEALNTQIEKAIAIANGSSADTVELSELINRASELAQECFCTNKAVKPLVRWMQRELYAFTVSYSRLNVEYTTTRSDCYSQAVDEYTTYKKQLKDMYETTKYILRNI